MAEPASTAWIPWILSGMSAAIAVVGLLRTFIVAGAAEAKQLQGEISRLQERLGLVEMKLGVFWRLVEEHMSDMLKRPTHLEMDALLEKLKRDTITLDEAYTLRSWLQRAYLGNATAPREQLIIAIYVAGALNARIIEEEHRLKGTP